MGTDFFSRKCRIDSRRILWIVALILASVVIVQYFDVPYGNRVLSLFPMGKSSFDTSGGSRGVNEMSALLNSSMPSGQKSEEGSVLDESVSLPDVRRTNEDDSIVRTSDGVSPSSVDSGIAAPPNAANSRDVDDCRGTSPSAAPSPYESSHEIYNVSILNSSAALVTPRKDNVDVGAPVAENDNGTSRNERNEEPESPFPPTSSASPTPVQQPEIPQSHPSLPAVASISDMNDMLLRSRASSFSETPLWSSPADQELLDARSEIEHAPIITNHPTLYARIYRNLTTFVKSYEIMERKLKVYVYNEGKPPVFHNPRLKGIYASEGWFMKHMEASSQFVTSNSEEARLFYLPFASQLLGEYVYVKDSHSFDKINEFLKNYVDTIKTRHPFWNRTDGADHFLVGCHDWAPYETKRLMSKCIRALCNSDIKEGFTFGKDVSLPETNVRTPQNPMRVVGGRALSDRTTLAFFAGKMHGTVRPLLLKHWENKDPDMKISGPIRKNYAWYMQNSKYCVCPKGYEVNSPRVVEAILYGCVPVIVSDNFVPPFFDILNWETFAVFVPERDIPNLKDILVSISETRYSVMQHRVRRVRKHFLWHNVPQRYDIFHMILHSVWYNRVFRVRS